MRTAVIPDRVYTYPDVSVVCGEPVCEDSFDDNLINPKVIFEVLSPSTEDYDRDEKFEGYKQMESLTDYVLVAQDRPLMEHYHRDPLGAWPVQIVEGLESELKLESIGCALPLVKVYDRVFRREHSLG